MATHGAMALIAVSLLWWIEGVEFFVVTSFSGLIKSMALGTVAGILVQAVQLFLKMISSSLQRLSHFLAIQFEGWTIKEIFFVALISSISEELLFRALLQPFLGLWITSAIFGLAHWTGQKGLRIWIFLAFLGGLFLGYLAEHPLFGLSGCIAAHFAINLTSLWILTRSRVNVDPSSLHC